MAVAERLRLIDGAVYLFEMDLSGERRQELHDILTAIDRRFRIFRLSEDEDLLTLSLLAYLMFAKSYLPKGQKLPVMLIFNDFSKDDQLLKFGQLDYVVYNPTGEGKVSRVSKERSMQRSDMYIRKTTSLVFDCGCIPYLYSHSEHLPLVKIV